MTASQLLNYAIISYTYIRFHKARNRLLDVVAQATDALQGNGPSRRFEGFPTLQRNLATFLCILCVVLHSHNGFCLRLHRISSRKVGRSDVPLLLYDDRNCATLIFVLESRPSLKSTWSYMSMPSRKTDVLLQGRAFSDQDFMVSERRIVDKYENASDARDVTLSENDKCI